MSQPDQKSCTNRKANLGSIVMTLMLAVPMGCVGNDGSTEIEGEATQALSSSFVSSCNGGVVDHFGFDQNMRVFIAQAHANSCNRNSGPPDSNFNDVHWTGQCFNDLSNRNGVITCAHG
jgi:hypothetical protein